MHAGVDRIVRDVANRSRPAASKPDNHGAWLSLVERCVRDAEVAGSNPVAPIFRLWRKIESR